MLEHNRIAKVTVLTFVISLICWLMTIANTYTTNLDVESGLSIFLKFPGYFWASIVFLGIGFLVLQIKPNFLLLVVGIAIAVLILFGTYSFVEPNARMGVSYYPSGMVSQILSGDDKLIVASNALNPYKYFNGFQCFTSIVVIITKIELTDVIKYFHLPLIFIIGLLFTVIAGRIMNNKQSAFLAIPLFMAAAFSEQFYYGPQLLAYTLLMLWLPLFIIQDKIFTAGFYICLSITFTSILFTHVLTPIPIIIFSIIYYLLSRFKLFSTNKTKIGMNIIAFFVITYVALLIYLAQAFFEGAVFSFLKTISSLDNFFTMFLYGRQSVPGVTLPIKQVSYYSHIIFYLLLFIMPILVALFYWASSILRKQKLSSGILIMSAWLICQLSLVALVYGGEIINRMFLYSLPVTVLFVTTAMKNLRWVFNIMLILLLLIQPLAYAGDECYKLTSDSELAGAKFFADNTELEYYFIQVGYQYIWYYNPARAWENFYTLAMPPQQDFNTEVNIDYLIRNTVGKNGFIFHLGYDLLDKQNDFINDNFDMIYINGNYQIYSRLKIGTN
jgi:hypothetical protein